MDGRGGEWKARLGDVESCWDCGWVADQELETAAERETRPARGGMISWADDIFLRVLGSTIRVVCVVQCGALFEAAWDGIF
jgi:hypothetical protein